jgi:VanZ family protein
MIERINEKYTTRQINTRIRWCKHVLIELPLGLMWKKKENSLRKAKIKMGMPG